MLRSLVRFQLAPLKLPGQRIGSWQEQTPEKLAAHFEKMADNLASKGIDKKMILEQAIITPSCGTGSLAVADGEKVFQTLRSVSQLLRAKHGS